MIARLINIRRHNENKYKKQKLYQLRPKPRRSSWLQIEGWKS